MKYDFLIVGAGLFGSILAHELIKAQKRVLVIDRRPHIGGNIYTETVEGIEVHRYGAHIFHTNNENVWNYVNAFVRFNRFTNAPIANYRGELFNLPFNMNTFYRMWGVKTSSEARNVIEKQRSEAGIKEPKNLEEQAISLVGRDIYEKLVKGYTEKQWGRSCAELPAFIIKRLPVRFTFDNNYFNSAFQGIPTEGYTALIERLLEGSDVRLGTDYLESRESMDALAEVTVFTGPIDAYYRYCYGPLAYRSIRFETELLDQPDFQGNAVVNYTDRETPWTRIIEHKWFTFGRDRSGNELDKTIISKEFSSEWTPASEPYYPVNDEINNALYARYLALSQRETRVLFGGRLGEYRYYDMDKIIEKALDMSRKIIGTSGCPKGAR